MPLMVLSFSFPVRLWNEKISIFNALFAETTFFIKTKFKSFYNELNVMLCIGISLYICDAKKKGFGLRQMFQHKIMRTRKGSWWHWVGCWAVMIGLVSCAEQYNIQGDSSVSTLDGRMLYLKVFSADDNMRNLDSCEVVHGKFNFMGLMDSTAMGEIYMDNEGFMPIVIENANVSIQINNTEQRVMGGSLNTRLYSFLEAKNRLEEELLDISNEEAEMILSGMNPYMVSKRLSSKSNKVYAAMEELETKFIYNNCNNILGSTYFMFLCNQYPYPIMTEQIKTIVKKSNASFRNIPYVREYIKAAQENMRLIEQGSADNAGKRPRKR